MVTESGDTSRLTVLGATGSIGAGVSDIVAAHPDRFHVEAVAAGRNVEAIAALAQKTNAKFAALADESLHSELKERLSGTGIDSGAGEGAVLEAAQRDDADTVVGAIVGAAGLRPTLAAVERGARVALANKECLVCAGRLFMRRAQECSATILPVDSEHSAVFQALDDRDLDQISRVTLTASGGPFRTWTKEQLEQVRVEDALNHPTWNMGTKVTIDSASLMNKGLELIEAHHLFGLPPEKLNALVQPQSIVHALVAYVDGSVLAQMAMPDMRAPIAYALAYPNRIETPVVPLDLAKLGALDFEEPDADRFPAIGLAIDAMKTGDVAMATFNAANEEAVAAFLSRKIGFLDIARVVTKTLNSDTVDGAKAIHSLQEASFADQEARQIARQFIANA